MLMHINLLSIFTIFLCIFSKAHAQKSTVLKSVHILFRHGESVPQAQLPETYNEILKLSPKGRGQLSDIGILQSYKLGLWLRKRYSDFIPETYNSSYFFARSSKFDRNIMSAMTMLAGFYNRSNSPLKKFGVNWQPVPVHVVRTAFLTCPRMTTLQEELYVKAMSELSETKYKSLFDLLIKETKISDINLDKSWKIYEFLNWMEVRKLELPEWYTPTVKKDLESAQLDLLNAIYSSKEMIRLEIGAFLYSYVEEVKTMLNGGMVEPEKDVSLSTNGYIMSMTSDIQTVVALLSMYGVPRTEFMPFGSTVMVELYAMPNANKFEDLFVKLMYKSGSRHRSDPENLLIPGCKNEMTENGCPFNVMYKIMQPYMLDPKSYYSACQKK